MRALAAVLLCVSLVACTKEPAAGTAAKVEPAKSGSAAPTDGPRKIAVVAGPDGYVPDKIPGKPGENIVLVFTRTVEGECLQELKAPDGKLHALPMNKPYEIAVKVPESGRVEFACGMDMFKGVVVADPRS